MLGRTAGGLFWMFRYLERSENMARLVEAGNHIAMTRGEADEEEWSSVVTTAGVRDAYMARHGSFGPVEVTDFLLRDRGNPSSVLSMISNARDNARMVRTALTSETWEAVNECWMTLKDTLSGEIRQRDLPEVLGLVRRQGALVSGAMHGTMLRNDIYNFARIGTFMERADNTARILDVKYYILLPSASYVGSSLDNMQWESILRSVSAERSYHWLTGGDVRPAGIADFLILDRRMPRSIAFCVAKICENLHHLAAVYDTRQPCHQRADAMNERLRDRTIDVIFANGLHEFLNDFIAEIGALGREIETGYRFYE